MDELKKITELITNHIVHRLDSIDNRLDLQEQVTLKMLDNVQDLTVMQNKIWKRLKHYKIIGAAE